MKIEQQYYNILWHKQPKDILLAIEQAGRTCYKSEDKITDNSCEEFVQRMINSGHMSMLEHGTVYLTIPIEEDKEGFIYKNTSLSSTCVK